MLNTKTIILSQVRIKNRNKVIAKREKHLVAVLNLEKLNLIDHQNYKLNEVSVTNQN